MTSWSSTSARPTRGSRPPTESTRPRCSLPCGRPGNDSASRVRTASAGSGAHGSWRPISYPPTRKNGVHLDHLQRTVLVGPHGEVVMWPWLGTIVFLAGVTAEVVWQRRAARRRRAQQTHVKQLAVTG